MIAILTSDVLLFLVHNAEIVKTATPLCVLLFLNRFLLIIFGIDNWIYGYLAIYLAYGVMLGLIIGKQRIPLEDGLKGMDDFEEILVNNNILKNTGVSPKASSVMLKVEDV